MPSPLTPPPAFLDAAAALGIVFDSGDLDRLGRYLELLLEANRSFNLTRITEPDAAWERHVLDSLALVPIIVGLEGRRVVDVGSGGGAPGIPLAIVQPDLDVTLVEATGKKARFLESVAREIGLGNVRVITERAETIGRDREDHRERYDIATARAVGPLRVLLELTVPLVRAGGVVLAIKGAKAKEEIAEAKSALHLLHAVVDQVVQGPTGCVVVVAKERRTPKLYPRRPGEPKRDPL